MTSPICSQAHIEEGDLLEFKRYDDRELLDLLPDPYDHEEGFSPSNFHPDLPRENREGSERKPEPEDPSGPPTGGNPTHGASQCGTEVEGKSGDKRASA